MSNEEKNEESVPRGCKNRFLGFEVERQYILGATRSLGEEVADRLVGEAVERRCMDDGRPCFHRKMGQACRMHRIIKG